MWLDQRGIAHTVDIPWCDAVILSPRSYDVLQRTPPAPLYDVLDDVEDDIFRRIGASQFSSVQEARYAERPPPRISIGLTGPQRATAEVLELQLRRQPLRWRLDYVSAVRDCLDALAREWVTAAAVRAAAAAQASERLASEVASC